VKVLHVISSVDPRNGGPIEGVLSSSVVWLRHGHERHILSLDPADAPWVAKSPVKTFAVGFSGRFYRLLRGLAPWLRYDYTPHLRPWLTAHAKEYDAVIVNGLWNYVSYGSWASLRKLDTPYFVFTHGMLDPWFNKAYPRKAFFKSIFWRLFEHRVLRDARRVLFTCEEERELASQSFSPYVADEFVIGYGTRDIDGNPDAQRSAFAAQVPELNGRRFVLFLSRLHPKKGVDLLIQAFARLSTTFPALDLVIAGPDQTGWKSELQSLARQLGVADRLHWPGMLSGDAKWGAFRAAEFFALPSHQENFGIVVAEAMALGKPVLISNKVNIWREIEVDGAGLVVNDDLEAIAAGLHKMCSFSPQELDALGRMSRKCFLNRYDLERNAMQLLELLARWVHSYERPDKK
jgi:glycosyltransferase involved in cell wall biosynthesis